MSSTSLVLHFLVCFVLFALAIVFRRYSQPSYKRPPGPRGLPLLGNLLDIPQKNEGRVYADWANKYQSDIVSASVLGTTIVVINSFEKTEEMLHKKSAIYSDRPVIPMSGELMGCKVSLGIMPYGQDLRTCRKMLHQELGSQSAIVAFHPHLEQMAKRFATNLLRRPHEFADHITLHTATTIMYIVYGHVSEGMDDHFIQNAVRGMDELGAGMGPFLINVLPQLRHLPEWFPWPGTHFKKVAKLFRSHYDEMVDEPFDMVKVQMIKGSYDESLVSKWLQQNISLDMEQKLKHTSGALFGAGFETTTVALNVFFLMMAIHSDVQKRAQAEVDDFIGRESLPLFEHREKLPYINAVCKEVLRTLPPVPLSLPHSTTVPDIQDGYFIPEKSIVFVNMWKILNDSSVHYEPERFNPDRFLGPTPERDPSQVIFGFGRRVCPGLRLADATLFITIVTVLHLFDILPTEEIPRLIPLPGVISHIKSFKCIIRPRQDSEKTVSILANT